MSDSNILRIVATVSWILFLLATVSDANFGNRRRSHKDRHGCVIPDQWAGEWVQHDNRDSLKLENTSFLGHGKCIDSVANSDTEHTFVIDDARDRCFRAFIIHQKHPNVLQYRKSMCIDRPQDSKPDASSARYLIESDSPTILLIRVDATPERCPLADQRYTFTYNRNHGECITPPSTVEQCNQNHTKLMFRFQACAEVLGTESSTEELTCIARWREGNQFYFIGQMVKKNYNKAKRNDPSLYRCYMYQHDSNKNTFNLAESADATCYGVYSAYEGSRVMQLRTVGSAVSQCEFPLYMMQKSGRREVWYKTSRNQSLSGKQHMRFEFSPSLRDLTVSTDTKDPETSASAVCIKQVDSHEPIKFNGTHSYVVEYQQKCETTYRCMTFRRRSEHVVDVQIGSPASTVEDACVQPYYDKNSHRFDTLYHSAPQKCFAHGSAFKVNGKAHPPLEACTGSVLNTNLVCMNENSMSFVSACGEYKTNRNFVCFGHYSVHRANTTYMIAQDDSKRPYCFVYKKHDRHVMLSIYRDQCPRVHDRDGREPMRLQAISGPSDCDNANHIDTASQSAMASQATRNWERGLIMIALVVSLTATLVIR